MRKLVTGFAVFGLAALVAAYVALAPLAASGPGALESPLAVLDEGAARLSEAGGRSAIVLALLGAGMALGMIAGFFVGAGSREDGDMMPAPGPVWRPEPQPGEHRIAGSLRRRAGAEEQPAFFEASADAGEEAASLETSAGERPPRPVILAAVEAGGAAPVLPRQIMAVLDAEAALLRRIDQEQTAERPERLTAEALLALLLDDDDALAGVREFRRRDQPGQTRADHDHVRLFRHRLFRPVLRCSD